MSQRWFYSEDGRGHEGPLSTEDVRRRAMDGSLRPDGWLIAPGMRDWINVDCMPGLIPAPVDPMWMPPPSPLMRELGFGGHRPAQLATGPSAPNASARGDSGYSGGAMLAAGLGGAVVGAIAAPLLAGSTAHASGARFGNATYAGGGILDAVAIDYNGDDVIDAVVLDFEGDGIADAIVADLNGDGIADAVGIDADGDGDLDVVGLDADGDGEIDTVGIDSDGDGDIDMVGVDTDGDGEIDEVAADLDNDGDLDDIGDDDY